MADFSTTGPLERMESEIVLMDSMRSYFRLEVQTLCGIPTVTLDGTPTDWRSLRARAEVLAELGLDGWLGARHRIGRRRTGLGSTEWTSSASVAARRHLAAVRPVHA